MSRRHRAVKRIATPDIRYSSPLVAHLVKRQIPLTVCPLSKPGFARGASELIATETLNLIENIKKRAGHLWRFL